MMSLNWYRFVSYSRALGVRADGMGPFLIAYLIGVVAVASLAAECIRLSAKTGLTRGSCLYSASALLYALPLLWHNQTRSAWIERDGAVAHEIKGYGTSPAVFWLTLVVLLLLQARFSLMQEKENCERREPPFVAPGKSPA